MFLRRFLSNRKAPPHTLQGRDSETSESEVATPMYSKRPSDCSPSTSHLWISIVYYRIYDEDGPTTSKTPAPGDPFLGRIKARSVPPPNRDTVQAVKRTIAKVENIKDRTSPSLLLSPYSRSPLKDADKVSILTRAGPGSTPQEPLAFVAKISDSRAKGSLSSKSGGRLESAGEPDTTPAEIYRTSIQYPLTFLFVLTFALLGGSILSALRRQSWKAIESRHWSRGAFSWSYSGCFYCATT